MPAAEGGYAVGAFNVTDIHQMAAVIEAAGEESAPVIIQTSVKPSQLLGPATVVAAFRALAGSSAVPAALHLDHCTDIDYCRKCADSGYTSIMIDASRKAFEENVRMTREVVAYAHSKGEISVEGELGTVGGVEDQIRVAETEAELCNPSQAQQFVRETGVDLLAPAIGTAHGIYTTANPRIDVERLGRIRDLLNGERTITPLVVHGGTGLDSAMVGKLIKCGGAKYNVSTELKHVWLDSAYNYLSAHRQAYDPVQMVIHQMNETKAAIRKWIQILGSTGKAGNVSGEA